MSKTAAWSAAILAWLLVGTAVHAGERHYYYTDQQGTVLAKADAAQNIVETSDYRPYGARALGAAANGPGYTGHVNDADSGLVYMQARYYDPEIGRFLSVDPKTIESGDSFKFNRFAYANDGPIAKFDPNGRDTEVSMMFHYTDLGVYGYYHEFVTLRDTNSKQLYVVRAGPSGDYPLSNGALNQKADQKGFLPLFGQKPMTLQASMGPIERSKEHGFNNKTLLGSSVVLKSDLSTVMSKAAKMVDAVNASNIPYLAQTTNSNAFANTVYQSLTQQIPPDQDAAKGSGTQLPINDCPSSGMCACKSDE